MIKFWIDAARIRTLPLALGNILMGNALAFHFGTFSIKILLLTIFTALTLQILSNFSNDLGDSQHGADNEQRKGPDRMVQSGAISASKMRMAVNIAAVSALLFGSSLIMLAFSSWQPRILFLILGLVAIWAAINYTGGSKPYGYKGYGDISVFIFFGVVAVVGSYYLQTKHLSWLLLLPASSCGAFSVAVLNINNIRDIDSDKLAGKNSIPVKIGRKKAVWYHLILLFGGVTCSVLFMALHFSSWVQFLFLLTLPMLIINIRAVALIKDASRLDGYLKQMAITTLLFVLTFSLGLLIS